jgi:hypothetical protein
MRIEFTHQFTGREKSATVTQDPLALEAAPPSRTPRFDYSPHCSNSSLRLHLENEHKEEYIRLCKEKGWKNQLPKSRTADLEPVHAGATQAFSRTKFTQEAFLDHLVNFIVADDQVCFLLVFY